MPKLQLLYFKNLFDLCLISFFNQYNSYFSKIDGKYVLSKDFGKVKLTKIFREYIINELKILVKPYDILQPNYYLILGSCLPKNNLLLDFKNDNFFPKKISKVLQSEYNIKYVLVEKDIDINIFRFNDICIELANDFLRTDIFTKYLGNNYRNVFFIQHNKLDCYVLFKVIKFIYGKSNCVNMYKEKLSNEKLPLIAINDIIRRYINKSDMNKSLKLKQITQEIKQYIDERLKNI